MHWARQARRVGCNASLTCGDRVVRANLSPDVAKAWMAVVSAWSAGAGRAGSGAAAKGKSVTAGPEQCEWTGKEDELVCVQVWYGHSVCMVAQNIVCAWSSARYILQKADDTSQCQTPDAVLRARAARAFKTIPNASSEASQVSGVWSRAPSESVAVYRPIPSTPVRDTLCLSHCHISIHLFQAPIYKVKRRNTYYVVASTSASVRRRQAEG